MRFQLPERRIAGVVGDLLVPRDDEVAERFLMLIEGAVRRPRRRGPSREVWSQQAAL